MRLRIILTIAVYALAVFAYPFKVMPWDFRFNLFINGCMVGFGALWLLAWIWRAPSARPPEVKSEDE